VHLGSISSCDLSADERYAANSFSKVRYVVILERTVSMCTFARRCSTGLQQIDHSQCRSFAEDMAKPPAMTTNEKLAAEVVFDHEGQSVSCAC
jgi:hypothetical protein